MAEEEDTTTEEEETAVEPVPQTVDERNQPIKDIIGQQATGTIDLSVDPDTGITPSLGAGTYTPTSMTVGSGEDIADTDKTIASDIALTPAVRETTADVVAPTQPSASLVEDVERVHSSIPTATGATGTLSEGSTIDPNLVTDERTKTELFERGSLAEAQTQDLAQEATVQYQVEKLMASLDSGDELPAWAAPSVRKAKAIMNQRGLGSSSMAAAAMIQALMESGVPIAAADAQSYARIQLQNLTNEQQTALSNAATIAAIDMKNLDNRMKAAQQNANTFLQMDLANLSNEQAAQVLTYQTQAQALFTDQAAVNAAKQFNATTQNQVNQFYDQLGTTVSTNNANRQEAASQFNADQANTMLKYEAKIEDAREKFNANMQLQIDQSNALWRRTINTANTAATNAANQSNAAALLGITVSAQNALWQQYRDEASFAFTASENEAQRALQLALTSISNQFANQMFDKEVDYEDDKASGALLANVIDSILDIGVSWLTS
tara:strand:- start:3139 stop:4623 length:1485 start_codon:yes stop_codon:yes gene_type:complete